MGHRRSVNGARMLITGASQGIGRALAEVAAQRGAEVLAAARSLDMLREVAESISAKGGTIEIVQADVTSPEDRRKMADAAVKHFGGLDVLVSCPGLTQTNCSESMLEQKALVQLDHMRGMTAAQVAWATLRAIERGKNEVRLSFKGKLICLVARFLPRIADWVVRRKVR